MGIPERVLIIGDRIFYRNMTAITSRIQQWVLKTELSHISGIIGVMNGSLMELEADFKVRVHTFLRDILDRIDPKHHQIFRWSNEYIPMHIQYDVMNDFRFRYEDHQYGYFQWVTIGLRRFFEWLGCENVRSWNILWGWGNTCSELYAKIDKMMIEDSMDFWLVNPLPNGEHIRKYNRLSGMLHVYNRYNVNLITPVDQRHIYTAFNDVVEDITNKMVGYIQ